jgi:hypothetical protein
MKNRKYRSSAWVAVLSACAGGLLVSVFFAFSNSTNQFTGYERKPLAKCIESHRDAAKIQNISIDEFYRINGFCYDSLVSQLLVDEELVRIDTFVFQKYQTMVLLFMVVTITLSGVGLAGLQLLASYKLAILGRGELAGGGELTYSRDSISFRSSVVGLMILAISFAFFMVYVIWVYTLTEGGTSPSKPGISRGSPKPQQVLFPVLPSDALPTPADGPASPAPVVNRPDAAELPNPPSRQP